MESNVFASSLELTVLEIETADVFIFKFFSSPNWDALLLLTK